MRMGERGKQISHLEQQRVLVRKYQELRESDQKAAHRFARSELKKAAPLRRNDSRRGDALELISMVQIDRGEFQKAIVSTTELVRIRKKADQLDHELLALALSQHAVALFALERSREADEALREQLAEWRKVFGADDVRLAQKLELQAEYAQKGFGRTDSMIELLQEAAEIRSSHPESSPGRLAQTLQELAICQMAVSEYGEADANLLRAQNLLEQEIAGDPAREENKSGLSQILVLRCGLAGVFAQSEQALAHANAARGLKFETRVLRAENEILVAAALGAVLELMGDLPGAIEEQNKILEIYQREPDLGGELDDGMVPDVLLTLSSLYLAQDELDLPRQAIDLARKLAGETSALLFQLSELERKTGKEAKALRDYQKGLRLRKESSTEMPIFFGTNRRAEAGAGPPRFGGKAADQVSLGRAVVLVPGGQFSSDAWLERIVPIPLPVGQATNPQPLFIRAIKLLSASDFELSARQAVARARLYPNSALVFVHGYNVPFEDAIKRGAQLVRDLNFDGPVFVFSWPSRGNWWRYGTDRLVQFLGRVAAATRAEKFT